MIIKQTKDLKDSEVYDLMNRLYSKIEPDTSMKKRHCQYLAKSGKRYCLMTSLKSCEKCRHFTPTTQSKMRILIEYVSSVEKENSDLKKDLRMLAKDLKEAEITIAVLRKRDDERRVRKDNAHDKGVLSEGDESVCKRSDSETVV